MTKEQLLNELQELFCPDHRVQEISPDKEEQLVKTFENISLNEALSDAKVIQRLTTANKVCTRPIANLLLTS